MSILLAAAVNNFSVLCTDLQHTNMRTKEVEEVNLPKIDALSDSIAVAHCGSAFITTICMKAVSEIIKRHPALNSNIEDVAEVVSATYSYYAKLYTDIESKCSSAFVVAGCMKNGNHGLAIIDNRCISDGSYEIIDGTVDSSIKIFPPVDLSSSECVKIVNTNAANTRCQSGLKYVEAVLRKTVQDISEKSQMVSRESQIWSSSCKK